MALSWPDPKDPQEILPYTLDWVPRLGEDSADTLSGSSWAIVNDDDDGLLVIDSDEFSDTRSTVWLSGGTIGIRYFLTNTVTTTGGWTMEQTFRLRIKTK